MFKYFWKHCSNTPLYAPKKSKEYLDLALSYTKNTFLEFKESYEKEITKKLKELDKLDTKSL